jgi:hypothetical protein
MVATPTMAEISGKLMLASRWSLNLFSPAGTQRLTLNCFLLLVLSPKTGIE